MPDTENHEARVRKLSNVVIVTISRYGLHRISNCHADVARNPYFAAPHFVSPTRASLTKNETTTDHQMPFAMQLCIILVFVENIIDTRRDRKRRQM